MFKRRKQIQDPDADYSIVLRAADGVLQRVFDADVVQSIRYMSTELTLNRNIPRRVAVIASLRGEGVTHTAVVLGAILANDTGARVCVVELNWWAPGLISLLDPGAIAESARKKRRKKSDPPPPEPALPNRPGLAQVLAGEVGLEEAILHSDMPNFDMIPAGAMPASRRPSTARNIKLPAFLDQLAAEYDHLILDVPAVRMTSDAIVLASLSDACIVVARQGVTSTTSVQQTLDDVKSLKMLGVVLNKVAINTPTWIRSLVPQE